MIIGYARVSSTDQDTQIQIEALKQAGASQVYTEQKSGTTTNNRPELENALKALRSGDTLLITRLDRLARSMTDFEQIMSRITSVGAELKATEQNINTATPEGRAMIGMLSVFAQFETDLRKERQREGVAKAKVAGKYKGRQPTAQAKVDKVIAAIEAGDSQQAICERYNISRASFYRIKREAKQVS